MQNETQKPEVPTPDIKPKLDRLGRRSRAIAITCTIGAFVIFALVVLGLVLSPSATDGALVARGIIMGCYLFVALLVCLYAWDRKESYDAITSRDYGAISMLLEIRPELEEYRQNVVAQGREFTRLDIELMSRYHVCALRWEAEETRRKEKRSVKAKIYGLTRVKKD